VKETDPPLPHPPTSGSSYGQVISLQPPLPTLGSKKIITAIMMVIMKTIIPKKNKQLAGVEEVRGGG